MMSCICFTRLYCRAHMWQQLSPAHLDSVIAKIHNDCEPLLDVGIDRISTKAFSARIEMIKNIKKSIIALEDASNRLEALLVAATSVHAQESAAVTSLAEIAKNPTDSESVLDVWKPATKSRQKQAPLQDIGMGAWKYVPITSSRGISAKCVSNFSLVQQDGTIYFVEPVQHFAIKIAGIMLHGNVGLIYADSRNVRKIKDCRFATSCFKKNECDYYHDPMFSDGSRDCRNYIAGGQRKFGSRDTIDDDLIAANSDDLSRYRDQTMHNILCCILMQGR